ncbi:MAG: hypothetical protein QOK43_2605 [Acidimicrobiaceae bacterium]|nr:hypothetical protein [Acidimicrobiaceae bacterium]
MTDAQKAQEDHDLHDPTAYGARIADDYDRLYTDTLDTEGAVALLAELAGAGPVLEWGVGTGRLAVPLAQRGLAVHGLDSSPDMLDRLHTKPGGERVRTSQGDFECAHVDGGPFALAVLAFNTVFALPSQDAQVRCFQNTARHLAPGGRFVVEAWVPQPERFDAKGEAVLLRHLSEDHVSLDVARIDPVTQRMQTTQVSLSDGQVRLHPANHRYAWPAELDLMARLAGMALEHRWADWRKAPFTEASAGHVSVYRLSGPAVGR